MISLAVLKCKVGLYELFFFGGQKYLQQDCKFCLFWKKKQKTDAVWFTSVKCFHTTSMTKKLYCSSVIIKGVLSFVRIRAIFMLMHHFILPVLSWKHLSCHFSLLILCAQEFQIFCCHIWSVLIQSSRTFVATKHYFALNHCLKNISEFAERNCSSKNKNSLYTHLFVSNPNAVMFPVEIKRRNLKNCCATLLHTGQFTVMTAIKVTVKCILIVWSVISLIIFPFTEAVAYYSVSAIKCEIWAVQNKGGFLVKEMFYIFVFHIK